MNKTYYVYEWFIIDTKEIFHVGMGSGNRMFNITSRNDYFKRIINKHKCDVRIYKNNLTQEEAYLLEKERIRQLKEINQAKTNFHEGGKGGNTFKYLPEYRLNEIKNKIGEHSLNKWKDEKVRNNITNSIRNGMNKSGVKEKISTKTKEAMSRKEVRDKLLEKNAQPVILKYKNGKIIEFDTNGDFRRYIKNKYNASTRIVYKLLTGEPFVVSTRSRNTLSELEGAVAYRKKLL